MTKTMTHTNCAHDATKAARAKCRKARKAQEASLRAEIAGVIDSYYGNTADAEEIISSLRILAPEINFDVDIEEIIGEARWI